MSYTTECTRFTMFEETELKELLRVIENQDLDSLKNKTLEDLRKEIYLELTYRGSN